MNNHRIDRTEKYLLALWFFANLCIGLLVVRDFGMSYDEPNYYLYAQNTVDAYKSFFGLAYTPVFGPSDLPDYGPAFLILPELVIRAIKLLFPNIFIAGVWHFSYFVIFELGGLCLFLLARRWFNRWTAWGILWLYTFQPVLWGHAFINPKDIPFMAFFLFTLWSGLTMADSMGAVERDVSLFPKLDQHRASLKENQPQQSTHLFKTEIFIFLFFLTIVALTFPFRTLIANLITLLYTSNPNSLVGSWFHSIAPQIASIPVENYIIKAQKIFLWIEYIPLIIIALVIFSHYVVLSLTTKMSTSKTLHTNPGEHSYQFKLADIFSAFRSVKVLLAGLLLGMTISIRILGPLPGIIIILYMVFTLRQRSLPVIFAYLFYAGLATFITWPYLWPDPYGHLLESLLLMSNFPWPGRTLFYGRLYDPDKHPLSYLPVLLNIQLTETFLVLFYLGSLLLIWFLFRKRLKLDLLLVLGLGCLLPLTGLIATRATMYDNFRQVLFIVPLLILISGFALEMLFSAIKSSIIRLVLLIVLAFPGSYAITQLHPYEYIYYNSFIGGVSGAYGKFELDYWRTALSELTLHLNEVAEPNTKLVVGGFFKTVLPYARSDFIIEKNGDNPIRMRGGYDYAILSAHHNADKLYPDAKIIYSVKRDGITLGVVKAVQGMNPR